MYSMYLKINVWYRFGGGRRLAIQRTAVSHPRDAPQATDCFFGYEFMTLHTRQFALHYCIARNQTDDSTAFRRLPCPDFTGS